MDVIITNLLPKPFQPAPKLLEKDEKCIMKSSTGKWQFADEHYFLLCQPSSPVRGTKAQRNSSLVSSLLSIFLITVSIW